MTLLLFLGACNEKLMFEPITTTDSDWTPSVVVMANDYQRIRYGIQGPPRKELLRNIVSYVTQIRQVQTGIVVFNHSDGNYISPAYLYGGQDSYWPNTSEPVLQYRTAYSVQVTVNYLSGSPKSSEPVLFTTPAESSSVVRRISIPQDDMSIGMTLAFHKKEFFVCSPYLSKLMKYDSSTGQRTVISNSFAPPREISDDSYYSSLTVVGDTLYTFCSNRDSNVFTLVSVDLNTLRVNSSVSMSLPGKQLQEISGYGSSLLGLWYGNNKQQIVRIDPTTGTIIDSYPESSWGIYSAQDVVWDGKNIWVSATFSFNTRLTKYDPATLQPISQLHNPVLYPMGIAWDGDSFWVIDLETGTISKLKFNSN